jgi:hypothetical protein
MRWGLVLTARGTVTTPRDPGQPPEWTIRSEAPRPAPPGHGERSQTRWLWVGRWSCLRYSRSRPETGGVFAEYSAPAAAPGRGRRSVGEPAEGSLQSSRPLRVDLPPCVITTFVALAGRRACPGRWLRPTRARQRPPQLYVIVSSEYYTIVKTFNNGSLGSGIDEERSEMR